MTDQKRWKIRNALTEEWETKYYNGEWLSAAKWFRDEGVVGLEGKRTNGARTIYRKILKCYQKLGKCEPGQEDIKVMTTNFQREEKKEILKEIGEIGCVEFLVKTIGAEVDHLALTCEKATYREVLICLKEAEDEGCCVGEVDLTKEEERLERAWKQE